MEGIVDAENKSEVKRPRVAKEILDEKEKELLIKEATYQPQFSKYLEQNRGMIGKTMTLIARKKAGMPDGRNGKPTRPYTNSSVVINNVLLQTKERLSFKLNGYHENYKKIVLHVYYMAKHP